jgi:hypothetical protein
MLLFVPPYYRCYSDMCDDIRCASLTLWRHVSLSWHPYTEILDVDTSKMFYFLYNVCFKTCFNSINAYRVTFEIWPQKHVVFSLFARCETSTTLTLRILVFSSVTSCRFEGTLVCRATVCTKQQDFIFESVSNVHNDGVYECTSKRSKVLKGPQRILSLLRPA